MKTIKLISFFSALFLITACSSEEEMEGKIPLAKVFDKTLYIDDLEAVITENTTPEDSISIVKSSIDLWIKKQLLLNKAEINLPDVQKDIERNVEDYRASLLIYRYKQEIIKQKLDTNIADKQIEEYYNSNTKSFKINREAVIAEFVKLPKSIESKAEPKQLLTSNKEEDISKLKVYCNENEGIYDDFSGGWIMFSEISNLLPSKITNPENLLKSAKVFQFQDEDYFYFIKIHDFRLRGQIRPLVFVKEQIGSVLLNKRKKRLIEELERNIFDNAENHNNIKRFEEKNK